MNEQVLIELLKRCGEWFYKHQSGAILPGGKDNAWREIQHTLAAFDAPAPPITEGNTTITHDEKDKPCQ